VDVVGGVAGGEVAATGGVAGAAGVGVAAVRVVAFFDRRTTMRCDSSRQQILSKHYIRIISANAAQIANGIAWENL
jgi:hypothetical protein